MNLIELAFIKAKNKKKFFPAKHSKIFSTLLKFEEMYLDELTEIVKMNEKETKKILDELISRKLIKKNEFKYSVIEPFEATNSFLFGKK
jgi:transcription initiation factor IIE alpha subunit